jgi:hypothetical protein
MGYFKPRPPEGPHQDVMKHISPQVSDMGIVIYRRTAAIKTNPPGLEGFKDL